MDISIVIVNYNVKHFLEQCLQSVLKSLKNLDVEIFVVDNNSADGSCQMIKDKFPSVKLIENKKNFGFAVANNQAIQKTSGKYILVINPDTVIEELTLKKCFEFMETHPEAGCLGVKMIDGKGNFLPESKRALPTPTVAFYKIFGLSMLFPKSRIFGRYHLGFLQKEQIHEIEVVSGAFMFIRKEVLDKTGSFDEQFFMYGEDIDLSYRIIKAGYKNYYFPETTIIHYKGESTKKGSINYVIVFYNAMVIFANKHFSHANARLFSIFINLAIYFRAGLAILRRFLINTINPVLNALIIFSAYYFFTPFWENYIFKEGGSYPKSFITVVVPVYVIIWSISLYLSGSYERNIKPGQLIRGTLIGSLFILLVYSLLPESLRFSRALIILGTIWVLISTFCFRYLLSRISNTYFKFEIFKNTRKILIIGDLKESKRVYNLLRKTHIRPELVGIVSPVQEINPGYVGDISQIEEIIRINKAEEIIFCSKSLSSESIIRTMLKLPGNNLDFKIAPPESLTIIGSNSINTAGDLYTLSFNTITKNLNLRKKRIFDLAFSFVLILGAPVLFVILKNPGRAFINILNIFIGNLSFVGYYPVANTERKLPEIKKGILTPVDAINREVKDDSLAEKVNMIYAKDYRITNDLNILIRGFFALGRNVFNRKGNGQI